MTGPDAAAQTGDVVLCRGKHCYARIRWALTVDGKWMPVDPDAVPDGTLVWARTPEGHRLRVIGKGEQVPASTRRFRAHWVTCPDSVLLKVRRVFPDAVVLDAGVPEPPVRPDAPARRLADATLFPDTPGE